MFDIPLISGKEADRIAESLGLRRKKVFWFVKESDKSLRSRMLDRIQAISRGEVRPMRVKLCGRSN